MIVKVFENEEFAGRAAADAIIAQISAKPNSVLGLPTGSTPVPTYRALSAACAEGRVSFKDVKTFNLDEYVGLNPAHEQSYRYFMNDNLFNHVDIDIANTNLPCDGSDLDEATAAKYDEKIIAAGGIDFQLLGIGGNGHIGFNEPGGTLASRTHVGVLTEQTRRDNARFFDGDIDQVPTHCVTQGLGTIMDSRAHIFIATGEGKADAVKAMIEGGVTQRWPASILQHHPDVTVLLDEAAASKLELADFYKEVWEKEHL